MRRGFATWASARGWDIKDVDDIRRLEGYEVGVAVYGSSEFVRQPSPAVKTLTIDEAKRRRCLIQATHSLCLGRPLQGSRPMKPAYL
ncbi:hypothetical protein EMIT0P228_20606 [Pseudomonas brassicacearum]